MPHLPATWKERKDADRERKVDRVMSDRLFQWTRTTTMRRVLVVVAAVLCVAIIPAFAQGGGVIGIIVTAVAWAVWGLLRMSTRTVADLPDRFLDERQRALRNRAYRYAYLVLGWIVAGLATVGLVAFVVVSENDAATLTTTWDQALGLVLSVTLLISLLPSMVVAWLDSGEDDAIVEIP
jgi:Na+/H+-translocating membrane pyrophosphatase